MLGRSTYLGISLGILAKYFSAEAIHEGAGGGFMIATQQRHMVWQRQLPASQQQQGLQAPCTSVHKVTCHTMAVPEKLVKRLGTSHVQPPGLG